MKTNHFFNRVRLIFRFMRRQWYRECHQWDNETFQDQIDRQW